MYILNKVSSKIVAKIPQELWTWKILSIRHLHNWGCLAEARPSRPHEGNLDVKAFIFYFIGTSFITPSLGIFLKREKLDSLRMKSLDGKEV